jgi:hypothetical protein
MKDTRWKPSPDISWTVETRGLSLVSRKQGRFVSIPYPHAGLWAMIADGTYSLERARRLMALLLGADERQAEEEIIRTLENWRKTGLVDQG